VRLTREEQSIYDGKIGEGRQYAMKILSNIGELYGATRLVSIDAAQLSCPRSQLGTEGWISLVQYFSSRRLKVAVPTFTEEFLSKKPKALSKISENFERIKDSEVKTITADQKKLNEHYGKLGLKEHSFYPPDEKALSKEAKSHMAVSDPALAVYLNSWLGVRTNIESSVVALSAAVSGKTTLSGMHLIENRIPDIQVRIHTDLTGADLALLGLHIGKRQSTMIPYFKFIDGVNSSSEKEIFEFSSALGHVGKMSMFHIANVTPEHYLYRPTAIKKKVSIRERDITALRKKWKPNKDPDLVILGAPYMELEELKSAAKALKGHKLKKSPIIWLFATNSKASEAGRSGYTKQLEAAGAQIFSGHRFNDVPLELMPACRIVTDSVGTISKLTAVKRKDIDVKYLPTGECIKLVLNGGV
jgi:predicted aconitase